MEFIPQNYGLRPEEWGENSYPSYEIIKIGKRATKELCVALPYSIWMPRALQWGRCLHIMNHILFSA